MELLYLWIEDYNVFKDRGFNFGGDRVYKKIELDKDKDTIYLSYKDNDNKMIVVLEFIKRGQNIINITGIVGENGAGKTQLLKFLKNVLSIYKNDIDTNFCIILKDSEEYRCISKFEHNICDGEELKRLSFDEFKADNVPVYFSNSYLRYNPMVTGYDNYLNISTESLLPGYTAEESISGDINENYRSVKIDRLTRYEIQETINEVSFLTDGKYLKKVSKFFNKNDLPVELKIDYHYNYIEIENSETQKVLYGLRDFDENVGSFGRKVLALGKSMIISRGKVNSNHDDKIMWNVKYIVNTFIDFIYRYNKYYGLKSDYPSNGKTANDNLKEFIDKYIEYDEVEDKEVNITYKVEEINDKQVMILKELLIDVLATTIFSETTNQSNDNESKELSEKIKMVKENTIKLINIVDKLKVDVLGRIIFKIDENTIKQFNEYYIESIIYEGNFKYEWAGISSGQWAQLKLFSRLYYFKIENEKKNKHVPIPGMVNNIKHVYFLLDEPDLYLHPDWQRTLIYKLIAFVDSYFADYEVQIIYTTNNPMTISDIPVNNLVFLKKEEGKLESEVFRKKEETFAANIYDLYADGFFLKEFLGEIPKKVIGELIREIDDAKSIDAKRARELRKLILLIGDGVIKTKLLEMLTEKIDDSERISWIDDTIRLLEKKRKNK
ncbi:MAG: AAA family ATPase [Candidatus Stygibacter australis]|nr:AAA family ATPase [Candidatus Stygibacter australis]